MQTGSLHPSLQFLIDVLQNIRNPCCAVDADNKPFYYNQAFLALTGYPDIQTLTKCGGLQAVLYLHPKPDWDAMKSGTLWQGSAYLIDKQDQRTSAQITILPCSDKQGHYLGAQYILSPSAVAENNLDYLQLLKYFVEHANDAVMITEASPIDEPGPKIIFVNPAFTHITGYTAEEAIGRSPRFLQGPDTDRSQLEKIRAALIAQEPLKVELVNYKKNGEEFWVDFSLVPVATQSGSITHYVSIQRETTQKKKAEKALLVSRHQLKRALILNRQILTHSLDVICIIDSEGKFMQLSPASERVWGYKPAELVGRSFLDFVHPDDQEKSYNIAQEVRKRGSVNDFENRYLHKDGSVVPMMWVGSWSAEEELLYTTGRNISERKEAENKLRRRTKQLEKINSELDQFVYKTSHDLRAPLVSLLGLIDLTQSTTSNTERNEYLSLMIKSVKKLDSFIHDIIDFSKSTRSKVVPQHINFTSLVEDVIENLRYMEEAKTISIKTDILTAEGFCSDQKRIEVILSNIISNAIRYKDPRKELSTILIEVVPASKNSVIIRVEDNGLGIGKAHLSKIFEMFYRATDANVGSGLGIYIVKESINRLKGKIDVNSELGKGTTFTIVLPSLVAKA